MNGRVVGEHCRPALLLRPSELARWLILLCVACAGCSRTGTQAISGSVSLDGAPLATGEIEFVPSAQTGGPVVGAAIEQGQYQVPAVAQGLRSEGTYVVRITSLQGRGMMVPDPNEPSGKREALENVIPARYNETSELSLKLTPEKNVHDFVLTTGAPRRTP